MGKITKKDGLTKKHWIGYMMGDFGGCMTFALMGSIVTVYYVDVLKINVATLAVLLLIWNIWDAVNDPIMGTIMDKMFAKHKNKQGKFRPWLLRSTPLLAVTSIAFWTVPTFFEGTTLICVLFLCKILYEACYTMFNIPMGSLLSAMANTDQERASLSSARGVGSMIGNVIPLMIMPQLLKIYGETNPKGYGIGAAICASIGFVVCFLHYYLTEERNIVADKKEDAANIKVTDILGVFKKNRPFIALCVHGICICTNQYVASTLGMYMYKDVLGDVGLMTYTGIITTPFMVLILISGPILAKKFGLEKTIRSSLLIGAVLYILLFALHMIMTVNPWLHIILASLASGISTMSIYMQWGMVGEAIDYNEVVTGKRTEGSIYGTFNLTRRIGQAIGNSSAVLMLSWVGYNAGAAAQSAGTINGIKVLCVLLPAIFTIGSWAAFKFLWNITPEIRAQIAERKAANKSSPDVSV
ncbi:MAG: MFS transporter [Clostridiaceae bacterium]|jgi:GPH family glycoside/pentoside/hexuronide:cation symporter|nr:MFS transporter [Clostridiaceae bacterium]